MAEREGTEDLSLAKLRAVYQDIFGKKPHHSWDAIKLRGMVDDRQANPPPPTAPIPDPVPPAADKQTVTISLVVEHVFMPQDPSQPDWETSSDTIRYVAKDDEGKRARYEVHPSLAEFLVGRDQAIVVG